MVHVVFCLARRVGRGDGVVPRGTEWTATCQPAQGQPPAMYWTVRADCVVGVFRTARKEPTRRGQAGALRLIPRNGCQHAALQTRQNGCPHGVDTQRFVCDARHNTPSVRRVLTPLGLDSSVSTCVSNRSTVVPSCPQSLSTTSRSTPTRYQPCGNRWARARMSSRNRRRIRFRTTAEPIRFGVENTTCTASTVGSSEARIDNPPSRWSRDRRNGVKPRRRGIRAITPTNGRDPCRVATSRRLDQPWSSSAYENHAFWHDDACWVEMYVSRLSPDVTYKAIGSNTLQARGVAEVDTTPCEPP